MVRIFSAVCLAVVIVFAPVFPVHAEYTKERLSSVGRERDFVVGPGKTEIEIKPGQTSTSYVYIANRTGKTTTFDISVEDFKGSRDPESTVVLLGDDRGPYSLRDFIHFDYPSVTLLNGERATIPVKISIPQDAQPGGRYGSVIFSAVPGGGAVSDGNVAGTNALITRIGTLFFITIPGKAQEDGLLKDFVLKGDAWLYQSGPIAFQLLFENNGNIYLNPSGRITIRNTFGETIDTIKVDPWYALPDSLRLREVVWERQALLGRYTAEATVARGYNDLEDIKTVVFWVLPWKILLGVFAIVVLVVSCIRWLFANISIKRRDR